jgi:cell filamentation protein
LDELSRYGSDQSRYFYPGTSVLVNLPGIQDERELEQFEAIVTGRRISELVANPLSGQFDLDHLKRIHRYIFQDVYPFAGKIRSENIAKGSFMFARASLIEPAARELLEALREEKHLHGLDKEGFCYRAAHYMAELNVLHPFREGNGRSIREFIRCLGLRAGWGIDWSLVEHRRILEASIRSVVDHSSLATVIGACIPHEEPDPALQRSWRLD